MKEKDLLEMGLEKVPVLEWHTEGPLIEREDVILLHENWMYWVDDNNLDYVYIDPNLF